jgi:hypothetical protein
MKTWKKIEETKKRTHEIRELKIRNEEKINQVSYSSLTITLRNAGMKSMRRPKRATLASKTTT